VCCLNVTHISQGNVASCENVAGKGAKFCNQGVCLFVYLFVCLSVRSHISKTTRPNFTKFSTCDVAWSSSDGNAICYVVPFLWMTARFHIIERIGLNR